MKKLLSLLLCLGMLACGLAYYRSTLALPGPEAAAPGQGILQTFCDRDGNAVDERVLYPAVCRSFDPEKDKIDRFWDSAKITGAQDRVLRITNQGATPCLFRTYVAFENDADVFDRLITLNWGAGFSVTPLAEELRLANDPNQVGKYRVFLVTAETALAPGETAEPFLQLFLSGAATNADVQVIGGQYTIRAATEAVWLMESGSPEADAISLELLGEPTLAHAQTLFTR